MQARVVSLSTQVKTITGGVEQKVHDAFVNVWGEASWPATKSLIASESGFNPYATNSRSGACGLFQSINCDYNVNDINQQIQWGINYIKSRYSTPMNAWNFHQIHGWY